MSCGNAENCPRATSASSSVRIRVGGMQFVGWAELASPTRSAFGGTRKLGPPYLLKLLSPKIKT